MRSEILAYDVLNLKDVYAVVAYCLAHEAEIDEYLHDCDLEAAAVRREIERLKPQDPDLREKLLARSPARGGSRAAPAG